MPVILKNSNDPVTESQEHFQNLQMQIKL